MHTKGPWKADGVNIYMENHPEDLPPIAGVSVRGYGRPVCYDNARLMAAAWEMANLLNDPRLDPPCDGSTAKEEDLWFANFDLWRQEARAILAKIEGKQQ